MMFRRRSAPELHRVDFSGHFENTAVAVGDYATANTYNGTVIQHFAADTAPRPTRRPSPQRRRPRDPVQLVGRESELKLIGTTLSAASAIGFFGGPGVGKTALLKNVAEADDARLPDGVVFANAGGQILEDVLQWLFSVYWDTGHLVYAPGPLRIGEYLADVHAVVVLDDVTLEPPDVERLVDAAPACGFAIGAGQPPLADERSYALSGLAADAAAALFGRVLGRAPTEEERADVDALAGAVQGIPGYVVTAAQLVRDGVCDAHRLVKEPRAVLLQRRLRGLPDAQRDLLGLLAELAPAAVPVSLLGPVDARHLEQLRGAGLVERNSPRYTLAGPVDAQVAIGMSRVGPLELLRRLAAEPDLVGPHDVAAAVAVLDWGARAREHDDVLQAATALVAAVLRMGRTGAWEAVAQRGLAAARRVGSRPGEALFLHELGTRLGVLGERSAAYAALDRARAVRRELGDRDALAVTEHNIHELFGNGPGGPHEDDSNTDGDGGSRAQRRSLVAGLVALVLAVGLATAVLIRNDASRSPATADATTRPKPTVTPNPTVGVKPTIDIKQPKRGEHITEGQIVLADYKCTAHGKSVPFCKGSVHDGEPISTARAGKHQFEVRARSATGRKNQMAVRYFVDRRPKAWSEITTPPMTVPPGTTPPRTVPPGTTPPTTVPPGTTPPTTAPPGTTPPNSGTVYKVFPNGAAADAGTATTQTTPAP